MDDFPYIVEIKLIVLIENAVHISYGNAGDVRTKMIESDIEIFAYVVRKAKIDYVNLVAIFPKASGNIFKA
jgi:hypothetical protein